MLTREGRRPQPTLCRSRLSSITDRCVRPGPGTLASDLRKQRRNFAGDNGIPAARRGQQRTISASGCFRKSLLVHMLSVILT